MTSDTAKHVDKNDTLTMDDNREEFVTFIIGDEVYGVDVLRVHEIIGMTEITPVPNPLPYMEGVINLRGSVVPVVDLRAKFKMEKKEYTPITVIIIVETEESYMGMIVDTVSDVVDIPSEQIHENHRFDSTIESQFIKSIAQTEEQLIIILNVDKIMNIEDLKRLKQK